MSNAQSIPPTLQLQHDRKRDRGRSGSQTCLSIAKCHVRASRDFSKILFLDSFREPGGCRSRGSCGPASDLVLADYPLYFRNTSGRQPLDATDNRHIDTPPVARPEKDAP